MKKILGALFTLQLVSLLQAQTLPTCSLDAAFTASNKYGVWPDSATNFNAGFVNTPYLQNITVKVPKDTIQSILKLCFTRFVVSTPSNVVNYGLPQGLTFGSSNTVVPNGTVNGAPSLRFPGNANACASVYGTPTVSGTYTLQMQIQAYATTTLSIAQCPAVPNFTSGLLVNTTLLKYYKIDVNLSTGIQNTAFSKGIRCDNRDVINLLPESQSLFIYSISGKLLKQFNIEPFEIKPNQLADLEMGIYILRSNHTRSESVQRILIH
jgi:hypothetical protein